MFPEGCKCLYVPQALKSYTQIIVHICVQYDPTLSLCMWITLYAFATFLRHISLHKIREKIASAVHK